MGRVVFATPQNSLLDTCHISAEKEEWNMKGIQHEKIESGSIEHPEYR